jgi:hypothetical protein
MESITELIKSKRLTIQYTKKSKYPLVFLDNKNLCESEILAFGFKTIDEFVQFYNKTVC